MKRLVVLLSFGLALVALVAMRRPAETQVNSWKEISHGVFFHEGDLGGKGHCNNGWVVFDDYVLVIDGNFPSGAKEIIPKIRALTNKPIRFAFDTHHHGDHAYGNQVWVDNGATPVAHEGVVEEMKKYEPKRWDEAARTREDCKESKLKAPTLLYKDLMIFDDGKRRVELRWFGRAHTNGDGFAWLPKEKILFTGDACVNGPFNYMGDGNSSDWIKTLTAAQKLGATVIGPGHGPLADGTLLEQQKQFFLALRREVDKLKGLAPEQAEQRVPDIRKSLESRHKKYLKPADSFGIQLADQVGQVYKEMSGKEFPKKMAREQRDQRSHAE